MSWKTLIYEIYEELFNQLHVNKIINMSGYSLQTKCHKLKYIKSISLICNEDQMFTNISVYSVYFYFKKNEVLNVLICHHILDQIFQEVSKYYTQGLRLGIPIKQELFMNKYNVKI